MTVIYLDGARRQLDPNSAIGKGGEADIYNLGDGTVAKVYKKPDDPDYLALVDPVKIRAAQLGAINRFKECQLKLPAFPKGLPSNVIAPLKLISDSATGKHIIGYTMKYLAGTNELLWYGDKNFREQGGIDGNHVMSIMLSLHDLVSKTHQAQVTIGDFTDLNVMVDAQGQAYLIDADSMQFGQFPCRTYTMRFLDPLHSDPNKLEMVRPHNSDSDWYAYSVMLFRSLLYAGPYSGVHRPKTGKGLQHDDRVLRRITVFDPDVIYLKSAIPYGHLPDELLDHFLAVYRNDLRQVFPLRILQAVRWTTCSNCGVVHARAVCPGCAAPGRVKEVIVRHGKVSTTKVFETKGQILYATHEGDNLRFLYHQGGAFYRESGKEVIKGNLDPHLRFRISGDKTILGKGEQLFVLEPGKEAQRLLTDKVGQLSIFDANDKTFFWINGAELVKMGPLGPVPIGSITPGRTLMWVGHKFGFGFYQAGQVANYFVFSTELKGISDQIKIPVIPGQLIDATCVFSDRLAWFLSSAQEGGRIINRCYCVNAKGDVINQLATEANHDENAWLASSIRGRFAVGDSLFAATDDGIMLVTAQSGNLDTKSYPDTEPFVDANTQLLPGGGGIYAVTRKEIVLIKIQ
jgi:hypothetical protein